MVSVAVLVCFLSLPLWLELPGSAWGADSHNAGGGGSGGRGGGARGRDLTNTAAAPFHPPQHPALETQIELNLMY